MKIFGRLVDIHNREIYPAEITVSGKKIDRIKRLSHSVEGYILPGLIDSHIHIESSMITPGAFGYAAVGHGTVGVVSDPHEIANVLGLEGVDFMISDSLKSPVKFWFGAPSCVPATDFETSGGRLLSGDIARLMKREDILYLSEMMNYPGVIYNDPEVMRKLKEAKDNSKPVDGHAPGLTGEDLKKYIDAGISTDHECSSLSEAREKIALGMKVIIREGSAARNLETLKDLFISDPGMIMLCSDDLHPEMLAKGHINRLISLLVLEGYDLFDVLRSASLNPSEHYNLHAGLLRPGDKADFVIVDSPEKMNVLETWIDGIKVFDRGVRSFTYAAGIEVNRFNCSLISSSEIAVEGYPGNIRVIEAFDRELVTREINYKVAGKGLIVPDTAADILKIIVKDRYIDGPPAIGFIKGFGLTSGAFASSVSHDSHNIIAVGTNDDDITKAINEIVRMKGGLSVVSGENVLLLELNIGGIMSTRNFLDVAADYSRLSDQVKAMGCGLSAPFMTLSFMALLVIPELKIGDKGLFDVRTFSPVPLFFDADQTKKLPV